MDRQQSYKNEIPKLNRSGVLPPYLGEDPGEESSKMSPYKTTSLEVAKAFGTSEHRKKILTGWLDHRTALRKIGITSGFQWIDGSFVEHLPDREPNDVDVVTFFYLPDEIEREMKVKEFADNNKTLFDHALVKQTYLCDHFAINLRSAPEFLISISRYFFGLFSHQRRSFQWKGMLEVELNSVDSDAEARKFITDSKEKGSR